MDGLTIGDVAKQANVRIETLRYYEREGLVARPPRPLPCAISLHRKVHVPLAGRSRGIKQKKSPTHDEVPEVRMGGWSASRSS